LHAHIDDIINAGAHHLLVILNKQDREGRVAEAKKRFEQELEKYADLVLCHVVDLPGISGLTGRQVDELVQLTLSTFQSQFKPKMPTANGQSGAWRANHSCKVCRPFAPEDDQYGNLSSDEFWKRVQEENPVLPRHVTRVRAAYFIVLEGLQNNRSAIDIADNTKALEWLQFDPNHRGNRYEP
jgi:hypothetical protein